MTTPLNERKCRVCGCTQDNCQQCIDRTGEPCHWVEDDLCSACVIKPEEKQADPPPLDVMDYNERILKQKSNQKDMNFFKQLNDMVPGVDVSLVLKEKNGKYTMSVLPNAGNRTSFQPLIVTGTPEELDEKFFELISKPLQETTAILKNADEHKNSVAATVKTAAPKAGKAAAKKPVEKKPAEKKATSKKVAAKKEKKEVTKPDNKIPEPDLFAAAE